MITNIRGRSTVGRSGQQVIGEVLDGAPPIPQYEHAIFDTSGPGLLRDGLFPGDFGEQHVMITCVCFLESCLTKSYISKECCNKL